MPVTQDRGQSGKPVPRSIAITYPALLKKVRETLLLGQRQIEAAKVRTYWQAGKHIHEHILHSKDRAQHGEQILTRLADDLGIGANIIYRSLKFYQAYPILATSPKLTWSHYVELSKVPDKESRLLLAERAEKSEWSSKQLALRIRQENDFTSGNGSSGNGAPAKPLPKLIPKLGELYTYALIRQNESLQDDGRLRADLGFEHRRPLTKEMSKGFRPGEIIESVWTEKEGYGLKKSARGREALFTYKAQVIRVVDGDTFYCLIDLGFEIEQEHYLRLRGVNCPELDTMEGKRAKAFTQRVLAKAPYILMTSTRSDRRGAVNTEADNWDRYVADVWIPNGKQGKEQVYLNQLLLDEGVAVRM